MFKTTTASPISALRAQLYRSSNISSAFSWAKIFHRSTDGVEETQQITSLREQEVTQLQIHLKSLKLATPGKMPPSPVLCVQKPALGKSLGICTMVSTQCFFLRYSSNSKEITVLTSWIRGPQWTSFNRFNQPFLESIITTNSPCTKRSTAQPWTQWGTSYSMDLHQLFVTLMQLILV